MPKRLTKRELLLEYERLLSEQPARAHRFAMESRLRSKDMLAASDRVRVRQATEFNVVFFRGRDSREDHGVVRESLYEVVEHLPSLQAARELAAARGPDEYGRRPLIRAISGVVAVGITVPEDFE